MSPVLPNGLPLWASTRQDVLVPRGDESDNTLQALALLNRYPNQQPRQVMNSFSEDLIPHTQIPVQMKSHLRNDRGEPLYGQFDPETESVALNRDNPVSEQLATLPHELAHAADQITGYDSNVPTGMPGHHKDFLRFEPEMAQSMDAQRAIEYGWPVEESLRTQYPWLRRVKPASSNRLASPWDFNF